MGRKKTNPNKIPLAKKTFDAEELVAEITDKTVLKGWALFLGALADFKGTSSQSISHLWNNVYAYTASVSAETSIADSLAYIEKITGLSMPYQELSTGKIKTKGDLDRFIRRANRNALHTFFSIIAEPIVNKHLLSEEDIPLAFRKAYALDDEVAQGYITIRDLLDILEEEYCICLTEIDGQVELRCLDSSI